MRNRTAELAARDRRSAGACTTASTAGRPARRRGAARELLVALGADLSDEGLRDTPRRMADATRSSSPPSLSLTTFPNDEALRRAGRGAGDAAVEHDRSTPPLSRSADLCRQRRERRGCTRTGRGKVSRNSGRRSPRPANCRHRWAPTAAAGTTSAIRARVRVARTRRRHASQARLLSSRLGRPRGATRPAG